MGKQLTFVCGLTLLFVLHKHKACTGPGGLQAAWGAGKGNQKDGQYGIDDHAFGSASMRLFRIA